MNDEVLSTVLGMLTKEQKEELAAKLIADVGNLQPEDQKEQIIKPSSATNTVNEDFTVTRSNSLNTGKQPVKGKSNTWFDDGENKDPEYDPDKYASMGRRPRPKKSRIEKVTKQCCVCNKSFEVAASLIYGKFYRCDNCVG